CQLSVVYLILAIHSHEQIEAVGEDDVHRIVLGKNLVSPSAAAELIVPGTTDQYVVAGTPFQAVVAAAPVQQVTEQAAHQVVVPCFAVERGMPTDGCAVVEDPLIVAVTGENENRFPVQVGDG